MPSYQLYSRIINVTCVCSADQFLHIIPKKVVHTRNKIYTTMYTYTTTCYYHHTADGPKAKHSRAFVILLSFDPPRLGSYSKKIGQIFYDRTTYTQNQDRWTYLRPPLNLKILLLFRKKNLIGTNSQGDFQCKTLKKKHE